MKTAFRNKFQIKGFVICIISLQLLCITYFISYINQCTVDENKAQTFNSFTHINNEQRKPFQLEKTPPPHHQYIKLSNYRAHFNTDPGYLHFGEINEHSLSGVLLQISSLDDNSNSVAKWSKVCDGMAECIGFSMHATVGILLHNATSFPLQYVRNWHFYIKNTAEHTKYEMNGPWINRRINYSVDLLSSSVIPSLSSLGLQYAVPIIPRQFMSFEWNVGRTNNQLYSFEAMMQYAVIYLRTLIIPFTTHRNHEMAMMLNQSLSVWDMLKFSAFCDFVFEHELAQHSLPADLPQYVLDHNKDINYVDNTFDIKMSADDVKWKQYFADIDGDLITNEPNWNLLELLEYRLFTNNPKWTLGHEGTIHNNWNDGEWKCYVSRGIRDGVPHRTLRECRLIQFCLGRYAHFKLDDWPIYDVLQFMIPSPRIRAAADNHIKFWFERDENYRVGLHRRAMKEGGKDSSGSPYVCRYVAKSLSKSSRYGGVKREIEAVIRSLPDLSDADKERKIEAITDLYDRTCATNFESIQELLDFHKQPLLDRPTFWDNRIKSYPQRGKQKERWFLACDNQEPEVLYNLIEEHRAVTLNGESLADFWHGPLYWNMATEMEVEQKKLNVIVELQYIKYLKLFAPEEQLKREYAVWSKQVAENKHEPRWWYDMSKIEFWRKEIVVFDMWMLRRSRFFVGSWHSTLTRNVCHWRGFENMYNSTNCYLHHKWRATNRNNEEKPADLAAVIDYDWFDINAVDKAKLIWKDGM